jgi:uncharacterized repeat protein (TIGR03803 family)
MRNETFSFEWLALLAAFFVTLLVPGPHALAQQYTVLHSFSGINGDGSYPYGGVISDPSGNLYGTTYKGGFYGYGSVFELMPQAGGGWSEKILHICNPNSKSPTFPKGGLIFDVAGNLYGTSEAGGIYNQGTVFELLPAADGSWTEKTLHSFNFNGKDGFDPEAGVVFDTAGNLYGTTFYGGTYDYGTVFELTPQAGGGWSERVLHSFNNNGKDGFWPRAIVTLDASGILYATTYWGGTYGYGTVFELSPTSSGRWTEKILHHFNHNGKDGQAPGSGVILDASGNLYGTTVSGGAYPQSCNDQGCGTVFELMPQAGGNWTEKVLHSFIGKDGGNPLGALLFDADGNLYSAAVGGPAGSSIFELTPQSGGTWTEKIVANLGYTPSGGLLFDAAGNIYLTTSDGSSYNLGTVLEITP